MVGKKRDLEQGQDKGVKRKVKDSQEGGEGV